MVPEVADDFIERDVGDGGGSGRIYLPKDYIGYDVKIVIPAENGNEEVLLKNVGDGGNNGVLYLHKKHLGKTVKIFRARRGG